MVNSIKSMYFKEVMMTWFRCSKIFHVNQPITKVFMCKSIIDVEMWKTGKCLFPYCKRDCTTCSYLRPLYIKQCLSGWLPVGPPWSTFSYVNWQLIFWDNHLSVHHAGRFNPSWPAKLVQALRVWINISLSSFVNESSLISWLSYLIQWFLELDGLHQGLRDGLTAFFGLVQGCQESLVLQDVSFRLG